MSCPLAVLAPLVGAPSETFIRRHMRDLAPGRTAIVVEGSRSEGPGGWPVSGPLLLLDRLRPGLVGRGLGSVRRRLGLPARDPHRRAFTAFLRQHGVRTILAEYLHFSLPFLEASRLAGCEFWVHAHGWDVSAALRFDHWRSGYAAYREAAGVITMSQASRTRLLGLGLGLPPEKVHAVPYGVDVPDTLPTRPRPDSGAVRCLAVGRMVSKKGPILTLAAFEQASRRCPSLHLDFIGGGDLLPAVQQFVRAYGLEGRVTLHGVQSSAFVRGLLERADVFLQHSLTDPATGDEEGLPVAILEAMAAGLPVLSTRHAGIPEAVVDTETGLLVEEGDAGGMAEHLIRLAEDPGLRSRLGAAAWGRARSLFTWQRERETLLRLLRLPAD